MWYVKNDETLRRYLTEAIAQCCKWGRNREMFGRNGAVAPLVKYLKSPNQEVHVSTAKALHQLAKYPDNCIVMHENGVVRVYLLLFFVCLFVIILVNCLYLASTGNGWLARRGSTRERRWLHIIH